MPVNRKPTRLYTQQITLCVIANTTTLCTPGSIITEMCYLMPHLYKKIHSIWMKNEYTRLSMGGKNVITDLLKFIPFYTSTRWYNQNVGIQNVSNYKIRVHR